MRTKASISRLPDDIPKEKKLTPLNSFVINDFCIDCSHFIEIDEMLFQILGLYGYDEGLGVLLYMCPRKIIKRDIPFVVFPTVEEDRSSRPITIKVEELVKFSVCIVVKSMGFSQIVFKHRIKVKSSI